MLCAPLYFCLGLGDGPPRAFALPVHKGQRARFSSGSVAPSPLPRSRSRPPAAVQNSKI